jgi:hypothetical protein
MHLVQAFDAKHFEAIESFDIFSVCLHLVTLHECSERDSSSASNVILPAAVFDILFENVGRQAGFACKSRLFENVSALRADTFWPRRLPGWRHAPGDSATVPTQ